jgi:putative ABC transport system permease protein
MACVVGVLLSMLAQTAGMLGAFETGSDPQQVIILSSQLLGDLGGSISRSDAQTIMDGPGIARSADGKPLADAEVFFWIPPSRAYTLDSPGLRGIGPAGLALRPGFRIVQGRPFRPGRQELIVGTQAVRAYGLKVGDRIILPDGSWPIVGVFSAGRSIIEGQLLGDAETIMMTTQTSGYSSVLAKLETPALFESLRQWLSVNPALGVVAERQSDYSLRTANRFTAFFTQIAYGVGVIMALGALFASVKIMYAAVSARTREMATLRAIGYGPFPLALSVVIETVFLAVAGAILGACVAWWVFNDRVIADNRYAFAAVVTPGLLALGLAWATGIAIAGALFPALRAARTPVTDALRAL